MEKNKPIRGFDTVPMAPLNQRMGSRRWVSAWSEAEGVSEPALLWNPAHPGFRYSAYGATQPTNGLTPLVECLERSGRRIETEAGTNHAS